MKFFPLVIVSVWLFQISLPVNIVAQQKVPHVLLDNLKNPCGVAIQPTIGSIFVAESGQGRVFRVLDQKPKDMIVDFPVQEFELDRRLMLGPLGIAFRDTNALIVASGGSDDGEDSIAAYDLEKVGKDPLKAEDFEISLTLAADDEHVAEGDFFSLAVTRTALFVNCGGDVENGWVAKADLAVLEMKNLHRFIPTGKLTKATAPGGLTISPDGSLVVAQMGSRDTPGDSVLAFYSMTGELLDRFPTGLNDIVAIAYGPRRKMLYALDFSWEDPQKGGLYQLIAVDTSDGCEAKLIAKLDRPTAMTFDRQGDLYITTSGIPPASEDELPQFENPGKLVVIRELD